MKKRYALLFLTLFLVVISITCSAAADSNQTNIGSTTGSDTTIKLNHISQTTVDEDVTVTGTVTKNNNPVQDTNVNINIGGTPYGDEEYREYSSTTVKIIQIMFAF